MEEQPTEITQLNFRLDSKIMASLPLPFAQKTALVTGGASGMGHDITLALLSKGAEVIIIDPRASYVFPPTKNKTNLTLIEGSAAQEETVTAACQILQKKKKELDYLVNAAGVLWFDRDRSFVESDITAWHAVLDHNLTSMIMTLRHTLPMMKEQGKGAIVNIASTQALRGDDKPQIAYQASKAAMISLSKTAAIEGAAYGVRSNSLCPGPTHSPMQKRWDKDPSLKRKVEETIPLGRVGALEDMTNACLFLLSDYASYITGTELVVDGGLTARP